MGRLLAIALAVAVAGITVVAVNGPGKDKPEDTAASTPARQSSTVAATVPAPAAAPSGQAGRPGATVVMRKLRFAPDSVTVERGQAVRFVNRDDVAHTVYQDLGPRSGLTPALDSDRIAPGQSYEFVADGDGQIAFVCTLHPTVMLGQILVDEPAA
jgi:plastocyanin